MVLSSGHSENAFARPTSEFDALCDALLLELHGMQVMRIVSAERTSSGEAVERDEMYLFIKNLTWDADDPMELARFWAAVLGSDIDEESTQARCSWNRKWSLGWSDSCDWAGWTRDLKRYARLLRSVV